MIYCIHILDSFVANKSSKEVEDAFGGSVPRTAAPFHFCTAMPALCIFHFQWMSILTPSIIIIRCFNVIVKFGITSWITALVCCAPLRIEIEVQFTGLFLSRVVSTLRPYYACIWALYASIEKSCLVRGINLSILWSIGCL